MAATAVSIATEANLNTAIADSIIAGDVPVTGTFTADVAETATPSTITALSGNLILDGGGESSTSDTVAYTLAADTAGDAVLALDAGGAVTLESLFIDGKITTGTTGSVGALTFEGDTATATNSDTVNGAITGAGSVTVTVNASDTTHVVQALILTGANTYTGATTIDAYGDLKLVAGGSIADSSGVSIAAHGELDISGASASVAITDLSSGGLVYLGDNTLVLTETTGAFTGTIHGAGTGEGTLEVYGALSLSATADTYGGATKVFGDVTLSDGGTGVDYDSSNFSLKESGATLTITNTAANTAISSLSGVAGSIVDVTAGRLEVIQAVTATFSGEIETAASGATVTFSVDTGVVLTLAGDSTYAGATTIEGAGDVAVTGSLATTAITVDGGTLSVVAGGVISDADSVTLDANSVLNISTATGPVGVVDLTGAGASSEVVLGAQTLVLFGGTSSSVETFDGTFSGTGDLQIGIGSSSSVQSTPSSSADAYYILTLDDDAAATKIYGHLTLDGSDNTSSFSLKESGATLTAGANTTIGSLSGVSGSSLATGGDVVTVDQTTAATFSGTITGTGGLTVAGTATLTLAGANTYSGATDIDTGATVALTGTGALGTGAGGLTLNGTLNVSGVTSGAVTLGELTDSSTHPGLLVLGNTTATIDGGTFNGDISGAGGVTVAADLTLLGSTIYTGATTIDAGEILEVQGALASASVSTTTTGELIFDAQSGDAITYTGVISGAGHLHIDSGKTILTGVSTFTGNTLVDANASLVLSGSGSLADSSGVTLDADTLLKLADATSGVTLETLTDAAASALINLGAVTLTLTGTSTIDGDISGTGGSLVTGTATETTSAVTLTLSGDDTYTGTTKVYGDLDLDTSLVASVSLKDFTLTSGSTSTVTGSILTLGGDVSIGSLSGETGTIVALGAYDLTIDQTTAATFSGTFTQSAIETITITGSAALTLATADAFTYTTSATPAVTYIDEVTVNGILTLGAGQTVTQLGGDGTINLGGNTLVDVNSATHTTTTSFSGSITGSGGLTVEGLLTPSSGTGTVFAADDSSVFTLSHAGNTFSGGILIENGTVEIAAAGAGGTGTITFNDNSGTGGALQIDAAALTSTGSNSYSFSNQITGVSTNDVIDLPGLVYDGTISTTYANGILTVTEDGVQVTLHISTSNVSSFDAYEDSHGGTFLVTSTDTTPYTDHYHP